MSRARNGYRRASYWIGGQQRAQVVAEPLGATDVAQTPRCDVSEGLRFGWTLIDLQRIAVSATVHAGDAASDFRGRVELAWSAAVEALYAATEPPAERDLWHAARHGIWTEIRLARRFHGAGRNFDAEPGSMPSFVRFWWDYVATVPSCEERVVEREALAQIWRQLTGLQQQAVQAYAAYGTAEAAADALGVCRRTFLTRLNAARRRFRELWHEGETPSGKWRLDTVHRDPGDLRPCGTSSAYARHRRRGELVDEACRKAWTAYQAERAAARAVA